VSSYQRPRALDDALAALATKPLTVLAGGTDYYPAHVGRPCDEDILDIGALPALAAVTERPDHWRLGALATWSTLARADLPPWFDGLREAAREVGGEQIQNAGTLGGNLCNASPAADGVPPLLALDAAVELTALDGREVLPLADFILGNRRTARRPDQLLTAVLVPKPTAARAAGHFLKLGARRYLVISIVMVGATLEAGADGRISAARLAVGACSAVAQRLPAAEAALAGQPCDRNLGARRQPEHLTGLAPLDDIRASAGYRSDGALTLVRRTVSELAQRL
jgi:CO/xanthine dehydrogenase FAD-binding subunit